jgi:energy-coupling factor transporter ATP-binding protein EcfA2
MARGPLSVIYYEPEDLGVRAGGYEVLGIPYVPPPTENEVKNKVLELLDNKEIVALVGPRGIGKSMLARILLAQVLRSAYVRGVVNLERLNLEQLSLVIREGNLFYILYYDASPPLFYELGGLGWPLEEPRTEAVATVETFVKMVQNAEERVMAVLVLPSDVYYALREEVRRHITPVYLDLKNDAFLASVIAMHSGCRWRDELVALVREIAKFNEGYTLIAKLAGEELKKRNCNPEPVEDVVKAAWGRAIGFMLVYVNELLRVRWRCGSYEDPEMAEIMFKVLAKRHAIGAGLAPGSEIMPPDEMEELITSLFRSAKWPKRLPKEVYRWLSVKHHDLIEATLAMLGSADVDVANLVPNKEELRVWRRAWQRRAA